MIDVIIPAYNAHDYILNAIYSILSQDISNKLNVYIVNDCSDKDYSSEIKKVKKYLNICELKTPKNLGPGCARQYGVNNSHSKYIIFIDADDVFNDCYSISNLYNFIDSNGYNAVTSNFVSEKETHFEYKYYNEIWMHGKMYRRSFLEENNIKFNNSYSNEDSGYNKLISLIEPFAYLNTFTYIWKYNKNSITRNNDSEFKVLGLEGYFSNMTWVAKEAKKKKVTNEKIACFAYEIMFEAYCNFIDLNDSNKSDLILKWTFNFKKIYDKYINFISEETKANVAELSQKYINICGALKYINNDISFNEFLKLIDKYNNK